MGAPSTTALVAAGACFMVALWIFVVIYLWRTRCSAASWKNVAEIRSDAQNSGLGERRTESDGQNSGVCGRTETCDNVRCAASNNGPLELTTLSIEVCACESPPPPPYFLDQSCFVVVSSWTTLLLIFVKNNLFTDKSQSVFRTCRNNVCHSVDRLSLKESPIFQN